MINAEIDEMLQEEENIVKEKFTNGGFVKKSNNDKVSVLIDRGWWKCKKCGVIFESYTSPPINHKCIEK